MVECGCRESAREASAAVPAGGDGDPNPSSAGGGDETWLESRRVLGVERKEGTLQRAGLGPGPRLQFCRAKFEPLIR